MQAKYIEINIDTYARDEVKRMKKNNAAVTPIISIILALFIVTSAVASVLAGATFGYETEGGSGLYIGYADIDQMGSYRRGTTYSPDYDGTLVSMHAFIQRPDDGSYSYKLTLAIFEEDGEGANSHKLIEKHTTGWILTSGWVDITGFSQSITAGTNYILAACAEVTYPVYEPVTINLGYDDVGTNRYYEEPVLSSGFPDREPWDLAEAGTGRKYSIYCTYTPSNNAPTQSGEIPANTSTGISVTPQLYVLCKDNDADNMNATWWSNSSGSWVQFASNWTSFANNTNITQPFTNASAYNTTYYWSVNLTDGTAWTNETYHFTTRQHAANNPSAFSNEVPTNGSTNVAKTTATINVTIEDPDGDTFNWTIETSPDVGSDSANDESNGSKSCSVSGLSSGTTYTWYVNCTDGTDWTREWYTFTTSYAPVLSNPGPINDSTDQSLTPICNVTASDQDGDTLTVRFYENTTSDDWLGISSAEYDSHCGDDGEHTVEEALDGTEYWYHHEVEVHWFVLDLGQTYTIKKVRGRSSFSFDPIDVDIYVSVDKENWGDAVATGISTWNDTSDWVEVDITDKDGRYIYVVINDCEFSSGITWGAKPVDEYLTIFDAYGCLTWVLQQTNSSHTANTSAVWDNYNNANLYSTKYWWRVNVSDGKGCYDEEIYHFTTAATNPPNAPTSPECDNQTNPDHVLDHTPYFDWVFSDPDGSDTQEGFHIQVGNDTDWGVAERWDNNQSSNTNSYTTYSGSTLYDGDTYYWRVKTKDNKSVWGSWTSNQNFRMNSVPTAPNLNSPANNSQHMPYTTESINLTWDTSTDAESDSLNYEWQYAEDSAFSVNEVHGWSGGPLYKPIPTAGNLNKSTDYYWHIRAWDGLEYSSYSVWRKFTTDDDMAPTQSGEVPTNGSTEVNTTPALYVICNDADGNILTATWRSNSSGGWVDFATNTSISPGTNITQTNSNFSEYNATYYWSVNVTDGISWTNETYHFTTESEDTPDGNGGTPSGNSGNRRITPRDRANTAPTADADGDGWSDEIEQSYGTHITDPNDYPLDTDDDGIPDNDSPDGKYTGDLDDDNDGLTDGMEEQLDTDPKNTTNSDDIEISGTTDYLVDTDDDGIYDVFYNSTSGLKTTVERNENGSYLIDDDGDGIWNYIYDPASGALASYLKEEEIESVEEKETRELPLIIVGGIFIVIGLIVFIVVIYKKSRNLWKSNDKIKEIKQFDSRLKNRQKDIGEHGQLELELRTQIISGDHGEH